MHTFFFLEIGLDLWGGGPFLANAAEEGLQIRRRKRIRGGEGSEEQQRKCSAGRDGSPGRPSKERSTGRDGSPSRPSKECNTGRDRSPSRPSKKCSTGRDGSPSRPSKKSARSESTPYLDGITDTIGIKHFEVVEAVAATILHAKPSVQPRPPRVK